MAVKIGHASIDENGKINRGTAGDQTTKEVCTRTWYNKGWTVLLRPKDPAIAEKMAKACEAGCANAKIGYDQHQRNTLRTQAKAVGFNLAKIATACETDCSAFMAVCAEAAGINMNLAYFSGNAPTTATMRVKFKATGAFDVLTDSKYLAGEDYLKRGDILVKEGSHTVMVLSNGAKVNTSFSSSSTAKVAPAKFVGKAVAGTYKTTANLNQRIDAGKTKNGKTNKSLQVIPKGASVKCYGYYNKDEDGTKWLYVVYKGIAGYCSGKYLTK